MLLNDERSVSRVVSAVLWLLARSTDDRTLPAWWPLAWPGLASRAISCIAAYICQQCRLFGAGRSRAVSDDAETPFTLAASHSAADAAPFVQPTLLLSTEYCVCHDLLESFLNAYAPSLSLETRHSQLRFNKSLVRTNGTAAPYKAMQWRQ